MIAARVLHLLSGLEIGGKENVALQLAKRARREQGDHRLLLYDTPFRRDSVDFDPESIPTYFVARRPGIDFLLPTQIARLISEHRIGIVHAHNDTAIFYGAVATLLARSQASALIGTFHAEPSHPTAGARLLTRWAARRAREITAVSQELNELLVRSGWLRRCTTLWNGVDLEAFRPDGDRGDWRRRLDIPEDAILVGHIGRFDKVKRQEDLLEAARQLRGERSKPIFVFVGQGPLFETFRRSASNCENIRLVPRVTDMATFLRNLDVVVLCSEREAAPLVLLEAMACGRAIVASAVGGVPYIMGAGTGELCGRMISLARPDLLVESIRALVSAPDERRRLGRRARERAKAFSFDKIWMRYNEMYQRRI